MDELWIWTLKKAAVTSQDNVPHLPGGTEENENPTGNPVVPAEIRIRHLQNTNSNGTATRAFSVKQIMAKSVDSDSRPSWSR